MKGSIADIPDNLHYHFMHTPSLRTRLQILATAAAVLLKVSSAYATEPLSPAGAADLAVTCELFDQLVGFDSSVSRRWTTRPSIYERLRKTANAMIWQKLPDVITCGSTDQRISSVEGPRRIVGLGRTADARYLAYDIENGRSGSIFGGICVFKRTNRDWLFVGCTDTWVS